VRSIGTEHPLGHSVGCAQAGEDVDFVERLKILAPIRVSEGKIGVDTTVTTSDEVVI
jgi:hypothetical protein